MAVIETDDPTLIMSLDQIKEIVMFLRKKFVWGPSVAHRSTCKLPETEGMFPCNCPKRYYCEGCDAQHPPGVHCPKTVLDDMVEAMMFKDKSIKRLIAEILDAAEARRQSFWTIEHHIRSRIDELANRFGNLGLSRRKLRTMVKKEQKRRVRRRGYERGL